MKQKHYFNATTLRGSKAAYLKKNFERDELMRYLSMDSLPPAKIERPLLLGIDMNK